MWYLALGSFLFCIIVCLIIYIVYLKFSARFSKPAFAFTVVSLLGSIGLFSFSALMGFDWLAVVRAFLIWTGSEDLIRLELILKEAKITLTDRVIAFGIFAITAVGIVYFSKGAFQNWEGKITKGVADLKEKNQENSIIPLAAIQLAVILRLRNDPEIDRRTLDWKQEAVEAPGAVDFKQLIRQVFLGKFTEARIDEDGWREAFSCWSGKMFGLNSTTSTPLVVFVFRELNDLDALRKSVSEIGVDTDIKLYCVYEDLSCDLDGDYLIGSRRVEFHRLMDLIRDRALLSNYARILIQQFDETVVGGTDVSLGETFVRSRVICEDGRTSYLTDTVAEWLADSSRRQLVITGEYGQGKSTAMLALCVDWARRYLGGQADGDRIPLLIELRGKSPGSESSLEFLANWAVRYQINPNLLYSLIKYGQTLLIFEGFDELMNAGRQYDRQNHFNALWRFAFPGTKVIFTGRPNFFVDDEERNWTLRGHVEYRSASNVYSQILRIQSFTIDEVSEACRAYSHTIKQGIIDAAREDQGFFEIVNRPSMIPVVATIWEKLREAQANGESITGSLALEMYMGASYARKEAEVEHDQRNRGTPEEGSYLFLPRAVREALTLAVVWRMASLDLKNTISRQEFERAIDLAYKGVIRALQAVGVRDDVVQAVRKFEERHKNDDRQKLMSSVYTDVASAGILVPDPAVGTDNLGFPHKQYFEFLAAKISWLHLSRHNSELVKAISASGKIGSYHSLDNIGFMQPLNRIIGDDFRCFKRYWPIVFILSSIITFMFLFIGSIIFTIEIFFKGLNRLLKRYRFSVMKILSDWFRDTILVRVLSKPDLLIKKFYLISISVSMLFSFSFIIIYEGGSQVITDVFAIITFIAITLIGILSYDSLVLGVLSNKKSMLFIDICRYRSRIKKDIVVKNIFQFSVAFSAEIWRNFGFIFRPRSKVPIKEIVTGAPISKTGPR